MVIGNVLQNISINWLVKGVDKNVSTSEGLIDLVMWVGSVMQG